MAETADESLVLVIGLDATSGARSTPVVALGGA